MNKKINFIAVIILSLMIIGRGAFSVSAAEERILHVSPNGNDKAAGTVDSPLKTPEGARKKVRAMKKGNGNIRVIFHEGDYEFTKPLEFNGGDAGTEWAKIFYEAAEGEDVNFVSSKNIDFSDFSYVSDKAILDRLPESSRGRVIQIDLKKSGITEELENVDFSKNPGSVCSDIALYLNNKEQMIAQWPNGRWNFTTAGTTYDNKSTFRSKDPEVKRWENAKNWYLYGFFSQDYNFFGVNGSSVDKDNYVVKVANMGGGIIQDTATRRYQAFNLLEEIDVATEWYIDRENLILYYFPPYELSENDSLQLSLNRNTMIKFNSYNSRNKDKMYTVFKNINFSKTLGNALEINADNVTVENCIFEFIGGAAIESSGENLYIENNVFAHVNSYVMRAVDYYTDNNTKDSPVYFRNNYIYDCTNYVAQACQAIASEEQNFTVANNTFHYSQGAAMSAGWTSRENKFMYNECYNLMKERSDIGMVYSGKSRYYHENEYAYNYFYDYNQKTDFFEAGGQGIYMDDLFGGAYIHHNILVNGGGGIQIGGGHDNIVENNIILDVANTPLLTDNRGEVWTNDWLSLLLPHAQTSLDSNRIVKRNSGIWDSINNEIFAPLNNVLVDNVSNCNFTYNRRFEELGIIENNIKVENKDSFVDAQNGDYRIKSTSQLASSLSDPWTENDYDLFKVGAETAVRERLFERNGGFELLYPSDNQKEVNAQKAELHWEQADTADMYVVTIATDPEMKNVVETLEVPYNRAEPKKLETGEKTYYWTVEAKNKSFKTQKTWKTSSQPYSFTTSKYDIIDYAMLEYNMHDAESLKAIMNEETYESDAIIKVENSLSEARRVLSMPYGEVTKTDYTNAVSGLWQAVDYANKNKIYHYESIAEETFKNTDKWILPEGVTANVGEGITFTTEGSKSYAVSEDKKTNVVYNFKAKIDFDNGAPNIESTFATFDLFREKIGKVAWEDTGYMIIVKQHKIELQKYKNGAGGIFDTAESSIVSDEGWHEYSYGLIEEADCYRVVFRIDGETIFDYPDYDKNLTNGYMAFANVALTSLSLDYSEATSTNVNETVYAVSHSTYSDSGSWTDRDNSRVSNTVGDTAVWDITPGMGRKELYIAVPSEADYSGVCEITVTYDYNKSREGEEVIKTYTVTNENIKDGWCYLDADDVQEGTITVKVTNISGKALEISAIKTVNAD